MTILYFIIGLGLLIFIHELGHFLVAKFSGIRVERFSLGFGPHVGFKMGETEYCLSVLPLGGYVKMSGQEDFEEGDIVPLDDPRAFSSSVHAGSLSRMDAHTSITCVLILEKRLSETKRCRSSLSSAGGGAGGGL